MPGKPSDERNWNYAEAGEIRQGWVYFFFPVLTDSLGQLQGVGPPSDAISKAAKLTMHCVFFADVVAFVIGLVLKVPLFAKKLLILVLNG